MTTHPSLPATATGSAPRGPRPLGPLNHAGLVLAALLGLADVAGIAMALEPAPAGAQNGPPADVLWFGAAMGAITLVCVLFAWTGRWRTPAVRVAAVARILSALGAVPAFFVSGVPAFLVALAAATVLLTVLAVVLMLVRPRRRS